MTRAEMLERARDNVTGKRVTDYGKPEDNFEIIGRYMEIYLEERCLLTPPEIEKGARIVVTAQDVANLMMLMKIGRVTTGTGTIDSYLDIAGYAACACAMLPEDEN